VRGKERRGKIRGWREKERKKKETKKTHHNTSINSNIPRDGQDQQLPVGSQPLEQAGERLGVGAGGHDQRSEAERAQGLAGVDLAGVDVLVRAQRAGEGLLVGAAREGHDAVAGLGGELDGQVAQAAEPLDGDRLPRAEALAAEGVEHGHARAEDRGVLGRVDAFGNGDRGFGLEGAVF
jgi:hypothetical protein